MNKAGFMQPYLPYLDWISNQQDEMVTVLQTWANINSGTDNLEGLQQMLSTLESAFDILDGDMKAIPLPSHIQIDSKGQTIEEPSGKALMISKHPFAPIKVLLGGHMDTVYPLNSPFQSTELLDKNTLRGPGVADMKGGLVILLIALVALERSPFAGKIGWEVLITPDEEIGSPGSESLWIHSAARNTLGLLFEPAFNDGAIVSSRKGSANFTIVVKGRSAHAGRDFYSGRNAISALVRFIIEAEKLNDQKKGITLNVGHIEGGGPVNIVPDLAIGKLNVRMVDDKDLPYLREKLHQITAAGHEYEGVSLVLYEHSARPPKPFDHAHQKLFRNLQKCASDLGTSLQERPSGGVCDGNILSAEGLVSLDTLGVVGGNIHTTNEYVVLSSLSERAMIASYFLMKLANQEIDMKQLKGVST